MKGKLEATRTEGGTSGEARDFARDGPLFVSECNFSCKYEERTMSVKTYRRGVILICARLSRC